MATWTVSWAGGAAGPWRGGAVTVGNFDGVHRGHQDLVRRPRALAGGGPAVAVTFDPPPAALLAPDGPRWPLTTLAHRAELLHAAGADHVVVLTTDAELLALSAADFFERVIRQRLGARAVVEGANFRFGRGRAGTLATLRELAAPHGIAVEAAPIVEAAGGPVSSSRVRQALQAGDVAAARELLGRPYRIEGEVVPGARRGRTLGFPTANLGAVPTLIPAAGVYAGRATVAGATHAAAAHVGPNPTFGESTPKVEVHLLDFAGDVYGAGLQLEFLARLRGVAPFPSADALAAQLREDVAAAREVHRAEPA